ncbi:MAG: hypothetical protein HZB21_03230 [Deltaproteobacteria bacterium]|nr:hypothetical protein [Deltaproteobacteria bacterium]
MSGLPCLRANDMIRELWISLDMSMPEIAAGMSPKKESAENLPPTSGGVWKTRLKERSLAVRSSRLPGSVSAIKLLPAKEPSFFRSLP